MKYYVFANDEFRFAECPAFLALLCREAHRLKNESGILQRIYFLLQSGIIVSVYETSMEE